MTRVIRAALPGEDVLRGKVEKMALDSRFANPKVDTRAAPPHAGILFVNWQDTSIVNNDDTKLLYSFPHGYPKAPTVFASYAFDNGSTQLNGTLPFQNGALGIMLMDSDDTNIYLKYYSIDFLGNNITPFTMQVRFYVMAEHGIDV